jgi:preprotein translocase subunit SecG
MHIWLSVLTVLQIIAAVVMIGLVLIQHGKGADMGASFGSGASGSLFGATGSASFLSRSTAVCAAVFFVCTLGLAFMSNSVRRATPDTASSILEQAAPAASTAIPLTPQIPTEVAPVPAVAPTPASGVAN